MQKSNVPEGVRTLRTWYNTKTLRFDLPIQRAAGQWSQLQKSLLVHSVTTTKTSPKTGDMAAVLSVLGTGLSSLGIAVASILRKRK